MGRDETRGYQPDSDPPGYAPPLVLAAYCLQNVISESLIEVTRFRRSRTLCHDTLPTLTRSRTPRDLVGIVASKMALK